MMLRYRECASQNGGRGAGEKDVVSRGRACVSGIILTGHFIFADSACFFEQFLWKMCPVPFFEKPIYQEQNNCTKGAEWDQQEASTLPLMAGFPPWIGTFSR